MAAKYALIIQWVKDQIAHKLLIDGSKLPTESALSDTFAVSRHTVRKALSELRAAGLVQSIQGSGFFITLPQKRKKVAFLTFSLDSYIFPSIISGISEVFYAHDVDLLVYSSQYSSDREDAILKLCLDSGIDGLLFTPLARQDFQGVSEILHCYHKKEIPIVFIDSRIPGINGGFVAVDDTAGGKAAARYFIDKKMHKNLVIYGSDHPGMLARKNAFIGQLVEFGSACEEISVKLEEIAKGEAFSACEKEIMDAEGIFCCNDQIAFSLLSRFPRVREKTEILGFDDSPISEILKLDSLVHPKKNLGRAAARCLLNSLDSVFLIIQQNVLFIPELKVREDTRRPI
jgi:GntR family transcriptional regulator of arabinose operon